MSAERCDVLCLDLEVAERLRRTRVDIETATRIGRSAKALSDPTRVQIAAALADGGELCVCDLAWVVERDEALVSHHVRVLRTAGAARSRREGKMVMYSLTPSGRELLAALHSAEQAPGAAVTEPRLLEVPLAAPPARNRTAETRQDLVRRARRLAWIGIGWHVIEAVVAIVAGLLAGSIALLGFGADSVIESAAGLIVLWLVARGFSAAAERRSQQLVAISFFILAAYVAVESVRSLVAADRPAISWVGIALSIVTLVAMPALALAKRRVGEALGSSAVVSEARQTTICAALSAALLLGLGANAALGWWWADPVAALVVAGAALREGRASWRGDACCAGPIPATDGCGADCCVP